MQRCGWVKSSYSPFRFRFRAVRLFCFSASESGFNSFS